MFSRPDEYKNATQGQATQYHLAVTSEAGNRLGCQGWGEASHAGVGEVAAGSSASLDTTDATRNLYYLLVILPSVPISSLFR